MAGRPRTKENEKLDAEKKIAEREKNIPPWINPIWVEVESISHVKKLSLPLQIGLNRTENRISDVYE